MNLRHLETYFHFCRFLSVSKTAEFLHITQPAVSQQLRGFEDECGVKLFYRYGGAYRLTETGEELFLLAKSAFARVEQIEAALEKARKATTQILRIGTTKAYARTDMPDLIAQFQNEFPRVQVKLSEGNSAELLVRLRNRKEDLVVVARTEYDAEFKAIPFARAEFVLVTRPDHPLAERAPISVVSLSGEPLIIREQGSGSRNAILKKLREFGVTPSVVVESESLPFILAYIARRMGVSFILSHEIEGELAAGKLKQIDLKEGNIDFYADIVVRRSEPMSVPMRHFLEIAKKGRGQEDQ
ncbi:MAG: LysR family transcriptional regulator [Thermodesulfobacteriota bacterium]